MSEKRIRGVTITQHGVSINIFGQKFTRIVPLNHPIKQIRGDSSDKGWMKRFGETLEHVAKHIQLTADKGLYSEHPIDLSITLGWNEDGSVINSKPIEDNHTIDEDLSLAIVYCINTLKEIKRRIG
jgi:hypothetical protein